MTDSLPSSMDTLLNNRDEKACERELLTLIHRLQEEGRPDHALCRALLKTAIGIGMEMDGPYAYGFLRQAHDRLSACLADTHEMFDKIEHGNIQ